ncbi:trigger factor, partial [Pseudomonas proteolytica]|uniref:trigger factor family protein n=1 Tax=Pseudomonas proteolytica TaxID=219574 RepID=UPI003BB6985C
MHGEALMQDALNTSIQQGIQELIAEHKLRPALQPSVSLDDGYELGKDADVKVELEVLPDVPTPAIDNLKLKKFEIDTLMLVAAAGAAALGAWAEGALLLFLFSLGHALEHYAMGRAKRAIEALAELAPDKATVRREGQTTEIPVEELVVG